eukprot:262078-Rhodomonas_salina.2
MTSREQLDNIVAVHESDQDQNCRKYEKRVSWDQILNLQREAGQYTLPSQVQDIALETCNDKITKCHLEHIDEEQKDDFAINCRSCVEYHALSHDVEQIEDRLLQLIEHHVDNRCEDNSIPPRCVPPKDRKVPRKLPALGGPRMHRSWFSGTPSLARCGNLNRAPLFPPGEDYDVWVPRSGLRE